MPISHYFIHNTPIHVRLQSARFPLLDCDSPDEFPHQLIFKFYQRDLIILLLVQKRLKLSYLACVMDPKNWTLPAGVELRTKKKVQDGKETQEL